MNFANLMARITKVADSFIPPSIAVDTERRNQARVFLISHLFGPFIGNTIPLALYWLDDSPANKTSVLAASISGFLLFPPLLRLTGLYRVLSVLSVQNLLFCVLWSCYFYGGVRSPMLSWVLIIPLLAFFYIGSSLVMRSIVIGLMFMNFGVFMTIYRLFPPPMPDISIREIENLGIISMTSVALYVAMMALYFAKVHASQSELEVFANKHLQMASELREATAELDRASAAKADFLAKMSHELRTPLNAIIGYSQMLYEDARLEGDQECAVDLDRIHKAGVHLLRMINEILDLAKIDASKMEIFPEPIALADLVRAVVDGERERATERGNVVETKVDPAIGVCLLDQQKVTQVLKHVVDNAIKFTQNGLVVVQAQATFGAHGEDTIEILVRDNGCGIAPEDLHQLFEQFTVLGDTSSSKYGGTGLGLALSRRFCRLLGGEITAQSRPQEGSTFTIVLPLRRPDTVETSRAVATAA